MEKPFFEMDDLGVSIIFGNIHLQSNFLMFWI